MRIDVLEELATIGSTILMFRPLRLYYCFPINSCYLHLKHKIRLITVEFKVCVTVKVLILKVVTYFLFSDIYLDQMLILKHQLHLEIQTNDKCPQKLNPWPQFRLHIFQLQTELDLRSSWPMALWLLKSLNQYQTHREHVLNPERNRSVLVRRISNAQ